MYAIENYLRETFPELKAHLSTVERSIKNLVEQGLIYHLCVGPRQRVEFRLTQFGSEYADWYLLKFVLYVKNKIPEIKARGVALGSRIVIPPPWEISSKLGIPREKIQGFTEKMRGIRVDGPMTSIMIGEVEIPVVDPPPSDEKKSDIGNRIMGLLEFFAGCASAWLFLKRENVVWKAVGALGIGVSLDGLSRLFTGEDLIKNLRGLSDELMQKFGPPETLADELDEIREEWRNSFV